MSQEELEANVERTRADVEAFEQRMADTLAQLNEERERVHGAHREASLALEAHLAAQADPNLEQGIGG